jgi:nucleoid-associated protein YgaU
MQSQSRSRTSTVGMRNPNRGGRTYTVAEGDTLFDIARYELGKASRWAEIYDLNRDVLGKDFNYLTPGTQLTLPDGEKPDVMAEPPTNKYRR